MDAYTGCNALFSASTMSGQRLKNTIKRTPLDNGFSGKVYVVIAGLSNTYSGYVTTYEEYQVARSKKIPIIIQCYCY